MVECQCTVRGMLECQYTVIGMLECQYTVRDMLECWCTVRGWDARIPVLSARMLIHRGMLEF